MSPFLYIIIGATMLEAIADIFFKYWTINGQNILLITGVVLYTTGTLIWAYSLKLEPLSKAITVFTILNLLLIILAGFIIFGEHISTLSKIGIVLGIVSVVLMLN